MIAALFLTVGAIGALVAAVLLVRQGIGRAAAHEAPGTRIDSERDPEAWARYILALQEHHAAEFAIAARWLGLDDVFVAGSGRLVARLGWSEESAPFDPSSSIQEQIRELDMRLRLQSESDSDWSDLTLQELITLARHDAQPIPRAAVRRLADVLAENNTADAVQPGEGPPA